jgi:NAD(P)-dependent dehydrogenase (short-subunit alcohol dehydrogenase family)
VAIGDWNDKLGTELAENFKNQVLFRKCDVSNWDNVLSLFQDATTRFGIIHSVISNAGINTHEDLFDETLDANGKLSPPSLKSIEVNLLGQLYVVRCAMHYFAKWPETACQLILTASAGAFFPAPPLYMYCAAKAGVVGLMRALRSETTKRNVTINVVAPWLTGEIHNSST